MITLYRYDDGTLTCRDAWRFERHQRTHYVVDGDDGRLEVLTRWAVQRRGWHETQREALAEAIAAVQSVIRVHKRRLAEDRALLARLEAERDEEAP